MRLDDLLADGKTEPAMRVVAVEAAERLEDLAAILRRDPGPVVAHEDAHGLAVAHRTDADMHPPGTVADGIRHQVLQHLNDLDAAGRDLRQWLDAHRRAALAKQRGEIG